ncbi:uncharacterized protein [Dermacentor albipictus]|uniref:uncharacterized protein n=1 Tax=Dermacentor albipictus TaxID=60249 RepID=UPI0031FCE3AA
MPESHMLPPLVQKPGRGKRNDMAVPGASSDKPGLDKRKASPKMLVPLIPRIPKTASMLLKFFIELESKVSIMREPLSHFCQEEAVLHVQECQLKLNKQVIITQTWSVLTTRWSFLGDVLFEIDGVLAHDRHQCPVEVYSS